MHSHDFYVAYRVILHRDDGSQPNESDSQSLRRSKTLKRREDLFKRLSKIPYSDMLFDVKDSHDCVICFTAF